MPDKYNLNDEARTICQAAASVSFSRRNGKKVFVVRDVDGQKYIRGAFVVLAGMDWERSPEGEGFWAVVYDALGALIT